MSDKHVGMRILWFLFGLLLIAAGVICFVNLGAAYETLVLMTGILMLMAGIAEISIFASISGSITGAGWYLAEGILSIILGIILLCDPLFTAQILPYIACFWLIMSGITAMVNCTDQKRRGSSNWGWLLALGIIMTIVGIILLFMPVETGYILAVCLGIVFCIEGIYAILKTFFYNELEF